MNEPYNISSPLTSVVGHQDLQEKALKLFSSQRLAHGWLFMGPQGVGKSKLAMIFAYLLLKHQTTQFPANIGDLVLVPQDPCFRRMQVGSHADFMYVESEKISSKGKRVSLITVEDVRQILKWAHKKPVEGTWRIVFVDGACAMNKNGANALLKLLEEPPEQCLLFLIAHRPYLVPETIRSRCQVLKFSCLKKEDFTRIVKHYLPKREDEIIEKLGCLSNFSVGSALHYEAHKGLWLYDSICKMISYATLHRFDLLARHLKGIKDFKNLNDDKEDFQKLFSLRFERFFSFIHSPKIFKEIVEGEVSLNKTMIKARSLLEWTKTFEYALDYMIKAQTYNIGLPYLLEGVSKIIINPQSDLLYQFKIL